MGRKRKLDEDDNEYDPPSAHLSVSHISAQEKRLVIILEGAQLDSVKIGKAFELMNCDDHANILKKQNKQPGTCRPDIVHQCLLMLLDSPLNRAGLLQVGADLLLGSILLFNLLSSKIKNAQVYIHTEKNVLIEINPQTRIPRTFKRFAGLMVQLLHKFSVRATETSIKLLKVIKNPITDHLPVGCRKLATSFSSEKVTKPKNLVPENEPVAIIIGAIAHGQVKVDYAEETISISNYPLSAALTCTKLCSAFEEGWNVL